MSAFDAPSTARDEKPSLSSKDASLICIARHSATICDHSPRLSRRRRH